MISFDRVHLLPNGGDVCELFRRGPRLGVLLNVAVRSLLLYFGAEAVQATVSNPRDRRFAGKGIAIRNALLVGAFSMLLPVLYALGPRRHCFPWTSDAILISVPVADMAGNSLDLYNNHDSFDLMTHFYGTAAVSGLMALAANGRGVRPAPYRWLAAAAITTFFHVLLEIQEYWTDVIFGTHNVEGLEDTEGDLLAGMFGSLAGVAFAEALAARGGRIAVEARRLAATLDPLARRAASRTVGDMTDRAGGTGGGEAPIAARGERGGEAAGDEP